MDEEEGELGYIMYCQINGLAAHLYQARGRVYCDKLNFRDSTHPEEQHMWNLAVISYAYFNNDNWYLQFQV